MLDTARCSIAEVTEGREVEPGLGEEPVEEGGPVLHSPEPGLHQRCQLADVAFRQVGQESLEVRARELAGRRVSILRGGVFPRLRFSGNPDLLETVAVERPLERDVMAGPALGAEGSEMSYGKPHETPCTDVLAQVYSYLDGELGEPDTAKIRQHLDQCGSCLREYGLEGTVKGLVHQYARERHVPAGLRAEVLRRFSR